MLEQNRQDTTARLRAAIEEELGAFRPLADLPSIELEKMATRIIRAIAPYVAAVDDEGAESRAA